MRFIHLYQGFYRITPFLLSFKNSFHPKKLFFTLSSRLFLWYCMFEWFNFVMFFSLIFCLDSLVNFGFLHFTKYVLISIWLIVTLNKFGEGVKSIHKRFSFVKKTKWNFLKPPMQMYEMLFGNQYPFLCCSLFFKKIHRPPGSTK